MLLPQIGGSARKTNVCGFHSTYWHSAINNDVFRKLDYTRGQLPELIDVIIEEKTRLFVSAVGVPQREVVDKLHKAGILVMNVSIFPSLCLPLGSSLTAPPHAVT